jgi:hypothetical protein
MTHNQHENGSAPNSPEPFDASDDAFDMYITSLYNEGRDLFARRLPLEAGLTAIVGTSDNKDTPAAEHKPPHAGSEQLDGDGAGPTRPKLQDQQQHPGDLPGSTRGTCQE